MPWQPRPLLEPIFQRKPRQRLVLDQLLALHGQATGRPVGKGGVEQAAGDEFEVGVAEEFEPLVGLRRCSAEGDAAEGALVCEWEMLKRWGMDWW